MPDNEPQYFEVDSHHVGRRLDNYLIYVLKGVPKSALYRLIRKGGVRVNKKRIKPDYRLQLKDVVRIAPLRMAKPSEPPKPSAKCIALLQDRVLHEDEDLLVINKPAGISVHAGTDTHCGVIEALRSMYPQIEYLELAHRLDRDTSGCLLIAKNRKTLECIHELLRAHKIKKVYCALTMGHWDKEHTIIELPLKKNVKVSGERLVQVSKYGKYASTDFNVLERFKNSDFVKVIIHTGRMHQIRVHAKSQSHPIAGDTKYGDRVFNRKMQECGLRRLFLHAGELSFILPETKRTLTVHAPLDTELEEVLTQLRR